MITWARSCTSTEQRSGQLLKASHETVLGIVFNKSERRLTTRDLCNKYDASSAEQSAKG